jgi:guanylate cyclase, other
MHLILTRIMTGMSDAGVIAFIGPDEKCTSEALMASAWGIPMISYVTCI